MNTKLLIGIGAVVAIALLIYVITRPEEAVAPVEESVVQTETLTTPEEDLRTDTGETTESASGSDEESSPSQTAPSPKTSEPVAKASAPESLPLPYTAVVVYNGERFIPDKITVIQGGTVRFVNTSNTQMWIASDNHPTHTRYPIKSEADCAGSSFDQCVAVGNGGSWSFVFTRTGTWGYHNHMRARDTGDIVVRTEEEYLKSR